MELDEIAKINKLKIKSKNAEFLLSFAEYCMKHPKEKFWQALRNWSKYAFVFGIFVDPVTRKPVSEDTFYVEE